MKQYPVTYDITKMLCEECYGQDIVWFNEAYVFICVTCGKEYEVLGDS